MTADLGVGANIAVEDAVVLCNILHREINGDRNRHFTKAHIASMFTEYQNDRYERAKTFMELSGKATRARSYDTLLGRFFATHISPWLYETQVAGLAKEWAKAPKLSYAPVQTIDEIAPGWLLAEEEDKSSGRSWLLYASFGAVAAGVATQYVVSRL